MIEPAAGIETSAELNVGGRQPHRAWSARRFAGGQIRSFLALISYFGRGEMRERYLGVRIPPTNLKPDFVDEARRFANQLAHGLVGTATPATATATATQGSEHA